ncbi:hypothetical protein Plhal710r2_c033g0122361 [Plasmopara halstedii]
MVNELLFTLRTDKFVRNRYALRMDPQIMGYGTVGKDTLYGVFLIYGRRFKEFQVCFHDIARNGIEWFTKLDGTKIYLKKGSLADALCDPSIEPIGM